MRLTAFITLTCMVPLAHASPAVTLTVAADGTGDFRTVQAAIDAVPDHNPSRVAIHIKPGLYKERLTVPQHKPFITFRGDDAARTVLTYDWNFHTLDATGHEIGTARSTSTAIYGDDFSAEHITFENSSGNHGQAVAITVAGDRATFHDCRFLGWQDTLLEERGRHYYRDCIIAGHVDFIFGWATAVFDHCEIHCRAGGYITAASTPAEQRYGFVFSHCKITADPDRRKTYLGRPWRPYASVTFLDTEMPDAIEPAGWDNWRDPAREKTARYAEYRSSGPGANPTARVPWSHQLTDAEAPDYTVEKVLGGTDGWRPG